uniref:E3 ubiquitin-protein ligase n=1 Tax=Timema genevievae TaxID=629358 RepID=A0A7R9PI55_TIMGE|nr:unnamed protein product [Timema genevievae]
MQIVQAGKRHSQKEYKKISVLTSFSKEGPFLLRDIFFCKAAASTALPFTSSPPTGEPGRDGPLVPLPPIPIFLGVLIPVPCDDPSRRGNCTLRVSKRSSVTHSSSRLLTVKYNNLHKQVNGSCDSDSSPDHSYRQVYNRPDAFAGTSSSNNNKPLPVVTVLNTSWENSDNNYHLLHHDYAERVNELLPPFRMPSPPHHIFGKKIFERNGETTTDNANDKDASLEPLNNSIGDIIREKLFLHHNSSTSPGPSRKRHCVHWNERTITSMEEDTAPTSVTVDASTSVICGNNQMLWSSMEGPSTFTSDSAFVSTGQQTDTTRPHRPSPSSHSNDKLIPWFSYKKRYSHDNPFLPKSHSRNYASSTATSGNNNNENTEGVNFTSPSVRYHPTLAEVARKLRESVSAREEEDEAAPCLSQFNTVTQYPMFRALSPIPTSDDVGDVQVIAVAGPSNVSSSHHGHYHRHRSGSEKYRRSSHHRRKSDRPRKEKNNHSDEVILVEDKVPVEIVQIPSASCSSDDDEAIVELYKASIAKPTLKVEKKEPEEKVEMSVVVTPSNTRFEDEKLNQGLINILECPVCMEYMGPPINQCLRGHLVADKLQYPCKNATVGCTDYFRLKDKVEHEANCSFRVYFCFLCEWKGMYRDMFVHILMDHGKLMLTGMNHKIDLPLGNSLNNGGKTYIISAVGRLFRAQFLLGIQSEVMGLVQFIGPQRESKSYKYSIEVMNKVEDNSRGILYTSTTHSDLDEIANLVDAGEGFCLRAAALPRFSNDENNGRSMGWDNGRTLSINISLEKVEKINE